MDDRKIDKGCIVFQSDDEHAMKRIFQTSYVVRSYIFLHETYTIILLYLLEDEARS